MHCKNCPFTLVCYTGYTTYTGVTTANNYAVGAEKPRIIVYAASLVQGGPKK